MRQWRNIRNDARGAVLVEFAIVLPVLLALLAGIVGYGQYLLLAHSAQQFANDAARAAVAGLDTDERTALAARSLTRGVAALGQVPADRVTHRLRDEADRITVTVTIDARTVPLLATGLVPLPDPVIVRRAVVHPGGAS